MTPRDWSKNQRLAAVRKCLAQIRPAETWRQPSSIATVAIGNSAKEGVVLLTLLEKHAPGIPVYVVTDPAQAHRFGAFRSATVIPVASSADLERLKSELRELNGTNFIHNNAAISYKFTAMRRAMANHGDCLFLDADFLPLASVRVPAHCRIGMSPHWVRGPERSLLQRYHHSGVFNVGQVWTDDPAFVDRWEWMFRHDSHFLEQEPFNGIALERPNEIGYWGEDENVGHWRNELPNKETVRSCHAHLSLEHLGRADPARHTESFQLAARVMEILRDRDKDNYWRACKALGIPTRLLFVHIPKTGGVTAIRTLIEQGVIHLGKGHLFHDGAEDGDLWRELQGAEEILARPEVPGVFELAHKHHFAWTRRELEIARENGWLTFSFLRHPADLICSKYWYFKREIADGRPLPFPEWRDSGDEGKSLMKMGVNHFLWLAIREPDLRKRWELPEWFDELVTLKMPFSASTLRNWIRTTWLVDPGEPPRHNASSNKGYGAYLDQLDPRVHGWLQEHLGVQAYNRYMPLDWPDLSEVQPARNQHSRLRPRPFGPRPLVRPPRRHDR